MKLHVVTLYDGCDITLLVLTPDELEELDLDTEGFVIEVEDREIQTLYKLHNQTSEPYDDWDWNELEEKLINISFSKELKEGMAVSTVRRFDEDKVLNGMVHSLGSSCVNVVFEIDDWDNYKNYSYIKIKPEHLQKGWKKK